MKRIWLLIALSALILSCAEQEKGTEYYVDPYIGTVAPLLQTTVPLVHRPHSMARIYPVTKERMTDRYLSDRVYGIGLNMPSYRQGTVSSIMATSGQLYADPDKTSSWVDKSLEEVHPWLHRMYFDDFGITSEWSATERSSVFRFTFENKENNIIFRVKGNGSLTADENVISGYEEVSYARQYFYAVIDSPASSSGTFSQDGTMAGKHIEGKGIGAWWSGGFGREAVVRVGLSFISVEQARYNLEKENTPFTFDQIVAESHLKWKNALERIVVEGGTERQRRIFYTSLYRNYNRMADQSEYGQYYSGFDNKVHKDSRPFYNDDWNWDTYRNSHALQMILNPQMKSDQLQSIVRMYEQCGWVPNFPGFVGRGRKGIGKGGELLQTEPMIGNHYSSVFAEAVVKGISDFDLEKAYEGLKKNSLEGTLIPWRMGPATPLDRKYDELGFFPGISEDEEEPYPYVNDGWEKRQSVSVTLEHSYDDWCLAQIAKYLGKDEDYRLFMERSGYWTNLWNPEIGFFAPKNDKGEWIVPFNPELSAGYGARYYFTENSGWVHQFHVQHDIMKLIELMGGKDRFVERIDLAYNTVPSIGKFRYLGLMPDATGLHGMIPAGNEPSFHIPYLYNYAGVPWKTQHRVRQIMDMWYDDRPDGLSGDEDGGALCAWYVFSAMGFYPVSPVTGTYAIGSPVFSKVTIRLSDGKDFTVIAKNASDRNKYIQSAKLNGEILLEPFITHRDIMNGSVLVLEMGEKPNRNWGGDYK